jgi:hypothetical protein
MLKREPHEHIAKPQNDAILQSERRVPLEKQATAS